MSVSVSDGNGGSDSIDVTISVTNVNEAPSFASSTATRSIAENTATDQNIGSVVTATDVDANTTLAYTLGGTDASSFGIVSTSGQLQTSAALNYESKTSYSVTVTASDGSLSDTTTVTINVTNVNEAPSFSSSARVTLSVGENTLAGRNIGDAFQATDPDSGDTVAYSLHGSDKDAFRIHANTGQLRTHAALDYDQKSSYSNLTVRATDSGGLVSSVPVTINVTEVAVNSAPVFTDGTSTTRSIAENSAPGTNIGTPVAATDADNDTLTYTLGGTNAASFEIVRTSGQLRIRRTTLDYETKSSYSVTVNVSDGNGGSDSIAVTINVTDVEETPANSAATFTEGTSTTRTVAENTALGTHVGSAVAATVAHNYSLTYTLAGADAAAFTISSTTGQLRTNAAIDYEVKNSYTVTVSVSDSNGGSDSITVTINVTDVAESPIAPPLSERTPQVRAAIVTAAPGVSNANDVTVAHLAAIAHLILYERSITALKTGDFNGLTGMGTLALNRNSTVIYLR